MFVGFGLLSNRHVGALLVLWPNCARRVSTQAGSHYDVLGVPVSASATDIKQAFRKQAKQWHPDLHKQDDTAKAKFSRCLLAYQVLSEPEARKCYDVSQDVAKPAALRAASRVAAFRKRSMSPDLRVLDWLNPRMWAAIAEANEPIRPPAAIPSSLAQPFAELTGDLQASLHKAYYGPSLHDLPLGHLPPAFEAEHRSLPGAGHVLQIVSGRTVLAGVREAQHAQLPGAASAHLNIAQAQPSAHTSDIGAPQPNADEQKRLIDAVGMATRERAYTSAAAGCDETSKVQSQGQNRCGDVPHGRCIDTDQGRASSTPRAQATVTRASVPQVLDYVVEDQVQMQGTRREAEGTIWLELTEPGSGELAAYVLGDLITSADGQHSHTMMELRSPGVMHTMIHSEGAQKVICKATRTWVPHDAFWLFPVRDETYRSGGWYVEWTGHAQSDRRGWLHPGIICLVLAFRALEMEAGRDRPWWFSALSRRVRQLK